MKKVILLSTVLGLGALGMACGEPAANNTNKTNTNVAPAASPVTTPATTPNTSMTNTTNSNMKPAANAPMNANKPK